jgi:hypothetical protein
MSFTFTATLIFLAWFVICVAIFFATRQKSPRFSSFRSRVTIAGVAFIVATLTCSGAINFILVEYYKELVRNSGGDKSFLEDFAYLSAQNLANYYTMFSSMFGASIGGSLLYKGLYPKH